MQPTKFSKLLRIVSPMIQGGLVGASADWRTNGGGAAAQNFFAQQASRQMQQKEFDIRNKQLADEATQRQFQQNMETQRLKLDEGRAKSEDEYRKGELGRRDNFSPLQTDNGIYKFDRNSGEASPVDDMHPENDGNLPLPGEGPPVLHPPKKASPSTVRTLSQGQELIDTDPKSPTYGQPIAKGAPKQFAPKAPRLADEKKVQQGKTETYAGALLNQFNGDADKALNAVEGLKSLAPEDKAAVRARIREMKRPATTAKRKFSFTQGSPQAQQLQTPGQ